MNAEIKQYPSGSISYTFKMYTLYEHPILCCMNNGNVRQILLEKINPPDEYDPGWRMTIHTGSIKSLDDVHEIGNAIKDKVFDILTFSLNTNITEIRFAGHNLTPREGEGGIICGNGFRSELEANIKPSCSKLSANTIKEIQLAITTGANHYHIGLYRKAIDSADPIVQFLMLYLILYDKYDNQQRIDEKIRFHEPSTPVTTSPNSQRNKDILETVYTRLRNEVTHRAIACQDQTKNEILINLDNFRSIVYRDLQQTQ